MASSCADIAARRGSRAARDLVQHQARCPTHQAAKAIESIQKSADCLKQQLENEYRHRATAEADALTLKRTINEMEEDSSERS